MITIERTSVMNFENAIRGARNPMNSWNRMDSFYDLSHDWRCKSYRDHQGCYS